MFRFEPIWLDHDGCVDIVQLAWCGSTTTSSVSDRIARVVAELQSCSFSVFGNVKKRIKTKK